MRKDKKHQRDCPAIGRSITSAECGAGSDSACAWPAECPHFPFTPAYDAALVPPRLKGNPLRIFLASHRLPESADDSTDPLLDAFW